MEEERRRVCEDCGTELTGELYEDYQTHDGNYYCNDCYNCHFTTCNDCEEVIDLNNDNYYETHYGDIICEDCRYDHYFECSDCNEIYPYEDELYIDGEDYSVCPNCRDNYSTCNDCDCIYHTDTMHEINGHYYCEDCYEDHENERQVEGENDHDRRINCYHGFSSWVKYKSDSEVNTRDLDYIGTETEFEPKGIHKMTTLLNYMEKYLNAVAMSDGSLNYGGVEIITHPETFKYRQEHKESYKQFFNKVEELEYGHVSSSGLHFHVSRPSEEVIARLIVILESFKDEVKKLSRRDGDFHWCKFLTDMCGSNEKEKIKYQCKKWVKDRYINSGYHDRYSALNLNNRNTIEFRFFNGVNNFEEYWGALQFINNLMKVAKDTERELNTITWKELINGKELEEQAKKLGVYDIDKNVVDTTEIIERYENLLRKYKEEVKCILRNLARYINKEMSELDLTEIRTSNVDFINEKVEQFMDKFKYRQQYLNKIMQLYNALTPIENTIEMKDIKNYWENTKLSFPVNSDRYKRYDKLIEKVIKNYENESEVM